MLSIIRTLVQQKKNGHEIGLDIWSPGKLMFIALSTLFLIIRPSSITLTGNGKLTAVTRYENAVECVNYTQWHTCAKFGSDWARTKKKIHIDMCSVCDLSVSCITAFACVKDVTTWKNGAKRVILDISIFWDHFGIGD